MEHTPVDRLAISIENRHPPEVVKARFPLRYGRSSEIRTSDFEFTFNLNGEIKWIRGLTPRWPHPAEQLKRTDGNDWVYYTVGDTSGVTGIQSWLGEYYLPCLPYPSNSIWQINYFANPEIMNAFAAWSQLYADLHGSRKDRLHADGRTLVEAIIGNHDGVLLERSRKLNAIIGERVSVLPPDTRHVDYEVIPLTVADGCLYRCSFCCVKSGRAFQPRSHAEVRDQIGKLREFYGRNLVNYTGLFLGHHDALAAGAERVVDAASAAYDAFGFRERDGAVPRLFLFGSVHSLLRGADAMFASLDRLPFRTFVNIGLESCDAATLAQLGKPLAGDQVVEAFRTMNAVNAAYDHVEVTANFVIGKGLSDAHYGSLKELLQGEATPSKAKGALYLSPLRDSPGKRELLPMIREIKGRSRLPVHVYLIQRL
jgi:hypothetical protein